MKQRELRLQSLRKRSANTSAIDFSSGLAMERAFKTSSACALITTVAAFAADSAASAVWSGALSSSYGLKQGSAYFHAGGSSQPSSRPPEPRPSFPRRSRLISTPSHATQWEPTGSQAATQTDNNAQAVTSQRLSIGLSFSVALVDGATAATHGGALSTMARSPGLSTMIRNFLDLSCAAH